MVNQNLNVLVTLKSAAAAAGLAQLGTGVSNLRQNFNKLGLAAGLVVGVLGAKVIQTAIAWESGFAGVKKTVDATAKEFAVLEKQFLALTKRLPVASADILKIGELAGQLGVKKKDIIAFTETIAKLAVTTNLTAESASLDFARFANILQYPIDEIDKLGSVLVDLGNNAATTESDILQAAKEMAGVGKIAGFSGQKILGIASAFSSVGIEAQVAGSSFQKAVLKIHEAAATGESSVAGFAAVAGLGAKEFRELWKTDAAEGFRLFVQGLGEQGDQAAITIGDLIGDDVRLKKAFLSVAAAGDLMTEQMAIAGIAFDENSALAEEASKRFETTESKLILLKNAFTAMFSEDATDRLGGFRSAIESLTDTINENETGVNGLFAIMGLFFKAVEGWILIIEVWDRVTTKIADTIGALVVKVQSATSALKAFLGVSGEASNAPFIGPTLGIGNNPFANTSHFAQGGMVPRFAGGGMSGDTVPAMLTPGEVILNAAQQKNLAGGLGGVTINFSGVFGKDAAEEIGDMIIGRLNLHAAT